MSNKGKKIGAITFGVFFIEAILHYNIGLKKADSNAKIQFPPTKQLVEIVGVVLLFSVANTVIINKLLK